MVRTLRLSGAVALLIVVATATTWAATRHQDDEGMLAVASAFNEARETCYSASDCPNLEDFMALFTAGGRRTEIQRNNNVVLLESLDDLRADHVRVASSFTGRKLETTSMDVQGRNVVMLQLNWDPGATEPNPFVSVLRIEDGKIDHWVLVAP